MKDLGVIKRKRLCRNYTQTASEMEMMTFRELRELQRKKDVAHLGPGAYTKNELTFGRDAKNVKISPPP